MGGNEVRGVSETALARAADTVAKLAPVTTDGLLASAWASWTGVAVVSITALARAAPATAVPTTPWPPDLAGTPRHRIPAGHHAVLAV